MRPRLVTLIAISACSQNSTWSTQDEGDASPASLILAEGVDVTPTLATITIKDLYFGECAGELNTAELNLEVDLLYAEEMTVPYGNWCLLEFTTDDPITLIGEGGNGGSWQLELSLGSVRLENTSGVSINGSPMVLELGNIGWLDADEIGILEGDVLIDGDHELHDILAEQLADGSALYLDDGDGNLTDDERAAGALITGTLR